MKQKGFVPIVIILVIVIIGLVGYIAFKGYLPKISEQKQNSAPLVCLNKSLNFQLTLPNETWQCDSKEDPRAGWVNLTSPVFTIAISGLGRGPYCGEDPDPEHLCATKPFVLSDRFTFTMYSYKGEDKEVFSELGEVIKTNPWISIKYKDMETKQLTDSQKQELLQLLNSLKTIN